MAFPSDLTKVMMDSRWSWNQECYFISKVKQVRGMELDWSHKRVKEEMNNSCIRYIVLSGIKLLKLCKYMNVEEWCMARTLSILHDLKEFKKISSELSEVT